MEGDKIFTLYLERKREEEAPRNERKEGRKEEVGMGRPGSGWRVRSQLR